MLRLEQAYHAMALARLKWQWSAICMVGVLGVLCRTLFIERCVATD